MKETKNVKWGLLYDNTENKIVKETGELQLIVLFLGLHIMKERNWVLIKRSQEEKTCKYILGFVIGFF